MAANMDGGGLRRKDTTKGPPLRILSLDGGGVRGYSTIIIIQELMHRTYVQTEGRAPRRDQIPKPCEYFDLICGTGTGGLIAIMLGRLRLDLETCKEVYIRMTRKVFETDKTIAGIPYRSTLFKASKLQEAIRECVSEHTIYSDEGCDDPSTDLQSPVTPVGVKRLSSNASVVSFSARGNTSTGDYMARPGFTARGGDPDSLLYDSRPNRTKTAVTAVYKGTPLKGAGPPAFLRSYDSRREPSPEFDCTIWEAGRATSATGLAFKPIKIGQSEFHDEGAGHYNPSAFVLDEATQNEWPGREVGVFISIGTGKRPAGSDQNQHLWYEDFMGEFAEARKKLVAKIEGCETTHKLMMNEHLAKRGVPKENYYRFNVEMGVGEFGMNEWNRLADISTGTKRYLGRSEVQQMSLDAAAKLSKIYRHKARLGGPDMHRELLANVPEQNSFAVELPAEVPRNRTPPSRGSYESGPEQLAVPPMRLSPRTSEEYRRQLNNSTILPPISAPTSTSAPALNNDDRFLINNPTPSQYRTAGAADRIATVNRVEYPRPPQPAPKHGPPPPPPPAPRAQDPPPIPPKTPILDNSETASRRRMPTPAQPPYPMDDGPPPVVNMAGKPDYKPR